jgi:Na+-transporting methylmalonyl-CoA/oxaloacetate decarboxylase gamma subunit
MLAINLFVLIADHGWMWAHFPLIWANSTSGGIPIAITGMLIVACALLLVCVFISSLPKVLAAVSTIWPEVDELHSGLTHPERLALDDNDVLAAIGFVLHHRLHEQSGVSNRPQR